MQRHKILNLISPKTGMLSSPVCTFSFLTSIRSSFTRTSPPFVCWSIYSKWCDIETAEEVKKEQGKDKTVWEDIESGFCPHRTQSPRQTGASESHFSVPACLDQRRQSGNNVTLNSIRDEGELPAFGHIQKVGTRSDSALSIDCSTIIRSKVSSQLLTFPAAAVQLKTLVNQIGGA